MNERVPKFLPEDFVMLIEKIAKLEAMLVEYGKELGESTEQSSETWHDNATYDAARSNFEICARELQGLMEIRNMAQIIQPGPDTTEQIILGSIVTILNEKTGKTQMVKITGDTIK